MKVLFMLLPYPLTRSEGFSIELFSGQTQILSWLLQMCKQWHSFPGERSEIVSLSLGFTQITDNNKHQCCQIITDWQEMFMVAHLCGLSSFSWVSSANYWSSSDSKDLYWLPFGGAPGCFEAVFFPFGVCGPWLRVSSWSSGDLEWSLTRFCGPTVAEVLSSLWITWLCCNLGGGGTTGCCWLACEDARGCIRSRDLNLSDLLEMVMRD